MVGLRNRLVHLYWEVDADVLHAILQNNLGDFDRFKAYIYAFLRQLAEETGEDQESPGHDDGT